MSALSSFARAIGHGDPRGDARLAALVLHALEQRDRDWLLASLSVAQRTLLEELLVELGELGIPSDPSLIDEIVARAPCEAREAGNGTVERRLEQLSASRIANLLRDEPPELIARLLRIRPWSWGSALLVQIGPTRADAVRARLMPEALSGNARPVCMLDRQLMARIDAALRVPAPAPAELRPPWRDRVVRRTRSWLGTTRERAA